MVTEMNQQELATREQLCEIGRRLWQRGLIAAFDGNLSVRLADDSIIATPSGVSKGFLQPENLVTIDLNGKTLDGNGKPSSEILMHLEIYSIRSDIRAVVHAHPIHATGFAVAGKTLPRGLMPEIDALLGVVPLLPYATPGTAALAETFTPHLTAQSGAQLPNVFLLERHGATCIGETLEQAWFRMESLEQCCQIILAAQQLRS